MTTPDVTTGPARAPLSEIPLMPTVASTPVTFTGDNTITTLYERVKAAMAAPPPMEVSLPEYLRFLGASDGEPIYLQALDLRDSRTVRAPNVIAVAESVTDALRLLRELAPMEGQGDYLYPNRVRRGVEQRFRPNRLLAAGKADSITDQDIVARRVVYIDPDVVRDAGEGGVSKISATAAETKLGIAANIKIALRYAEYLGDERAFGFGFSGNSGQLHVRLADLDPKESQGLVDQLLVLTALIFDSDKVHIDRSVRDPKRICPAWGTLKRKGERREGPRPWRATWFVAPTSVRALTMPDLENLVTELARDVTVEHVEAAVRRWPNPAESLSPVVSIATLPDPARSAIPTTRAKHLPPRASNENTDVGFNLFGEANAQDLASVIERLGLPEACPSCGAASKSSRRHGQIWKCFKAGCSDANNGRSSWGAVDFVAAHRRCEPREAAVAICRAANIAVPERSKRTRKSKAAPRDPYDDVAVPDDTEELDPEFIAELEAALWASIRADAEQIEIMIGPDVDRVLEEGIRALARDPDVYSRGGSLVVVRDTFQHGERVTEPAPIALPVLRERHLSRGVRWLQVSRTGKVERVPPPLGTSQAIHAAGYWDGIRELTNVVDTPVMRPDGSVLTGRGYDGATCLYLASDLDLADLDAAPSLADAMAARDRLLGLFADFPLLNDLARGVVLASILSPLARPMIPGPIPGILTDANIRRVGKGLLVQVISAIAQAQGGSAMPYTNDAEECRKRITGALKTPKAIQIVDDVPVRVPLGNSVWCALLTAASWEDRELGASKILRLPSRSQWIWTGNNVELLGDITARILHIRLETDLEHPETRTGFTIPDLLGHVRAHRADYVRDALTVLRAWVVAGRPNADAVHLGGFEAWARIIGAVIHWLGLGDVTATQREYAARCVAGLGDAGPLLTFMRAWGSEFGGEGRSASDVIRLVQAEDDRCRRPGEGAHVYEDLREVIVGLCGHGTRLPSARSFGRALAAANRRRVSGMRFEGELDSHRGAMTWFLRGWTATEGQSLRAPAVRPPDDLEDDHYPLAHA